MRKIETNARVFMNVAVIAAASAKAIKVAPKPEMKVALSEEARPGQLNRLTHALRYEVFEASGVKNPNAGRTVKIRPAAIGNIKMPITNGGTNLNTVFSIFADIDPPNEYGDRN